MKKVIKFLTLSLLIILTDFNVTLSANRGGENMSQAEIKNKLTPLQYHVTQKNGTERPFQNEYWNNKKAGIYIDVVSGEPLFSSTDKYASGSGWPSFTRPIAGKNIVEKGDHTLGMQRIEIRSKLADSHLGHLFDDGPKPSGLRYCVNSASLRFVPVENLVREGYGQFVYLFNQKGESRKMEKQKSAERATFAGGCFWGVESILNDLDGVLETTVGYTGGQTDNPTYRQVCTGSTGHAEAVEVRYDPAVISFTELLDYFWRLHDPRTLNRQGPDVGSQYRSAIFYHTKEQKEAAEESRMKLNASGVLNEKVVTEIVPAAVFYSAEEYHQDYFAKNGGPACHILRDK